MKGNNELRLNEATMIEALQYWLNAQMAAGKAPAVNKVTYSNGTADFIVQLTDPEVTNPEVTNPEVTNPEVTNPEVTT